ncbi:isocitrate lyase/phosphoenolpyruvate mutase family protein [Caulobacter sp. 17J80-11]|uniref:isocitrate lyase/PEP mutase family protein n=1 Tax=Caulobacter sp. 17J80-11 TaxID=2763502 RepID=UPI0016535AFC|nr:isocitrate lyase/phosphoenolpyruvate mutase family protein [Caulobacter sp. 17J80-11]MBC6982934.1 isocitrate lyase/phosphoenolpyruvate mutase family protein [Caulobacter sp. 17J80-11]
MPSPSDRAALFRSLHVPGRPVVLYNVWDAGTAKAVAAAGAKALATGSWSVAAANGYPDGERVPLDFVIANVARIAGATDLPLTVDLETGYGATPEAVGETLARAIGAGAIGCNLEDSLPADGSLRPAGEQAQRIAAARAAADRTGVHAFLNARCDVFFQPGADKADESLVATLLERARAYADAGADGLFVPGLSEAALIARVVAASPLPVNVMAASPDPALAGLGVARVSFGPGPYRLAMKAVEDAARAAFEAFGTA